MIEINKSLHGAKGKIKAVYLGTTPVVMYLGDQLLYDVDLDAEYVLTDIKDGDTIDSTIEASIKSAILKGQTLVNHCPDSIYTEDGWGTGGYRQFDNFPTLVKGKTYTFYAPIGSKEGNAGDSVVDLKITTDGTTKAIYNSWGNGHGTIFKTFTMGDRLWFNNYSITGTRFQQNYPTVMILEGEWTQESMPEYFKGMQSVKNYYPIMNRVTSQGFGGAPNIYESYFDNNRPFNAGKTFTVFVVNPNISRVLIGLFNLDGRWIDNESIHVPNNKKFTYTVPESKMCKFVAVYVENNYDSTGFENSLVVLEGNQTHLDIDTYFEGAEDTKSFKKSILTITGKNLFNKKDVEFNYGVGNSTPISNDYVSSNFIKVKPSTQYVINNSLSVVYGFDINGKMIGNIKDDSSSGTFTTPDNCYFIRIRNYNPSTDHQSLIDNAQLEIGSSVTAYEPYKSNILNTSEDVVLRGIGDVKDTLDCLTGEVVERIGEVVLNGSEDEAWNTWIADSDSMVWTLPKSFANLINPICDRYVIDSTAYGKTEEMFAVNSDDVRHIQLRLFKTTARNINELKIYLQSNPITVQYELATPTIKTVDLTIQDQDNKTISTLNTFNDTTHFTVKGEEGKLQPVLSMEIACNPSQAISQLSDKTEQLQQEQQELTEQVEQQEQDTNNLQTATTDLEEV